MDKIESDLRLMVKEVVKVSEVVKKVLYVCTVLSFHPRYFKSPRKSRIAIPDPGPAVASALEIRASNW